MATEWRVEYLRPDGWSSAGGGFESREDAEAAAKSQLPSHVSWRVVPDLGPVVSKGETPRVPSDPSDGAPAEGNEAAAGVSCAAPVVTETADKAAPGEGNGPDAGAVPPSGPEVSE